MVRPKASAAAAGPTNRTRARTFPSERRLPTRVLAYARIALTVAMSPTLLETPGGIIGWFGWNIGRPAVLLRGNPAPPDAGPPAIGEVSFFMKSAMEGQSFPAPWSSWMLLNPV